MGGRTRKDGAMTARICEGNKASGTGYGSGEVIVRLDGVTLCYGGWRMCLTFTQTTPLMGGDSGCATVA